MQRMIKQWLMFGLAVGVFASCSQEGNEPNSTAEVGGETVSFSLSAEVSVDDPSLRAIDYKLGNNANGELVPMPQFTDKQEVEVHTILKSSTGTAVAKTLKWRYDATEKKLVLKQNDGHNITISGFNNDNSTKWYISGLIGGTLNGTEVEFMGTRVVKGVDGNAGDALGSMEVPYAFGWTELTINTSSSRDNLGSHKYAEVPKGTDVKFKPLGSMLAVKLGTAQWAGAYSFTPKGFTLASNAWGDQGSFELNTDVPQVNPHTALPIWKKSSCSGSMYYTFASGEEPGIIAHNQTAAKTYYVWAISHETVPTTAEVRVMLKGTSSRPETATYKDYTNTWFTDYTTKPGTQGKVTQGKVHPLTAKASHRLAIPIEYVTDYNLAGGEGLTYTRYNNPQPAGVTGTLRFANSHDNDQSGYYNWYKVVGRYDSSHNPQTRNLQTEVDNTFGVDRYYIPTFDQWWGVFPADYPRSLRWSWPHPQLNYKEMMRVGSGPDEFKRSYLSDYSQGFGGDEPVLYSIRFKSHTGSSCLPDVENWDYDASTNATKPHAYPRATDNSMRCAYRFRRVGTWPYYIPESNTNLTSHLIVDVVYLGEESTPTELAVISDEAWWAARADENKVISRIFSAPGALRPIASNMNRLAWQGAIALYSSSNQRSSISGWAAMTDQAFLGIAGHHTSWLTYGLSVRLFARRDL